MATPGDLVARAVDVYCKHVDYIKNKYLRLAEKDTGLECIFLARGMVDLIDTYTIWVLQGFKAISEATIRGAARIMFIEADIDVVNYLASNSLVDPQRAQQAVEVLQYEEDRIDYKHATLVDSVQSSLPELDNCFMNALEALYQRYQELGCKETIGLPSGVSGGGSGGSTHG